jgi:hypothetical protein
MPAAPEATYTSPEHGELVLRGSLSASTRRQYARVADPAYAGAAASAEDVWARSMEFLFERLAVRWTINEVPTEGQKELLTRYRVATADERRWLRDVLREHCAEHFPEVQAP